MRTLALGLSGIIFAACGASVSGNEVTDAAPAAVPDGSAPTPDAPLAWATPTTAVPGLSAAGQNEEDANLSPGELEMIMTIRPVGNTGGKDIAVVRRDSVEALWGEPTVIAVLDSAETNQTPRLSPDGLTMYFSSNRPGAIGGGGEDVWTSTREALGQPWAPPTAVPTINTPQSERWLAPCSDPAGAIMGSSRPGGLGGLDLYNVNLTTGQVTPAPEISSASTDFGAWLSADCLTLVFASNRGGGPNQIYSASRTAVGSPWTLLGPIPEFADGTRDMTDPWVSADGRRIFMTVTPVGGGNTDIHRSSR